MIMRDRKDSEKRSSAVTASDLSNTVGTLGKSDEWAVQSGQKGIKSKLACPKRSWIFLEGLTSKSRKERE